MAKLINRVPVAIRARTDKELTIAMLNNNLARDKEFAYFDIQQTPNGGWVAWYFDTVTTNIENRNPKTKVVRKSR